MSCTKFDQLVEAVAKKKGCRQAQVESTGHKNHRQNKRATGEKKNSPRYSGGGRNPPAPPALAHGSGPRRTPAAGILQRAPASRG